MESEYKNIPVVILNSVPDGMPKDTDFAIRKIKELPTLKKGQMIVKILFISVDPYLRMMMGCDLFKMEHLEAHLKELEVAGNFQVGEPLYSGICGVVECSKSSKFKKGDLVTAMGVWAEYIICSEKTTHKLDDRLKKCPQASLGICGLTGVTAHLALHESTKLRGDETVVVSAAGGALGSAVGQIAKMKGCTVVGITSRLEKEQYMKEVGFDACVNYKSPQFLEDLKNVCPNGVDLFIDSVGCSIFDSVMKVMNKNGRVVVCGVISMINSCECAPGLRIEPIVLYKRLTITGLIAVDHLDKWCEVTEQLIDLFCEDKLKERYTFFENLDKAPEALICLFTGGNIGKTLIKL